MLSISTTPIPGKVDEPQITQSDAELRSHVERVLDATYELDREIGRGGMGIVYRAKDRRLKRTVAIKLLPPELAFRSEIRSRFLREAETAAQLSHPCIVPIYSVDEKDGLVFFVMAFVDGDTLAKRIHDRGALDPVEVRRILCEVGDALAYAHAHGVVHRDIKPDNILLDATSNRPMVTDFGIARAISDGSARLTATGIAIGTPAFMSPEQSAGDRDVDGRSDLYSLGVVAYQMLCGELPFNATNTPALLVKHLSERPVPVDQRASNIPPDLARAVMLCLEKNPDDRFPTAQDFVTALNTGNVPNLPPERVTQAPPASSGYANSGYGQSGYPSPTYTTPTRDSIGSYEVTNEDRARWEVPQVVKFRKRLGPVMFVGAALVVLSPFSFARDLLGVWGLVAVFVAYRYALLWSSGYDWHDVFRQPRHRLFMDHVSEFGDEVQAFWNPKKRVEVRERHVARLSAPGMFSPVPSTPSPAVGTAAAHTAASVASFASGPHAAVTRRANEDCNEIVRLVESLPKADRARIPEVISTAQTLNNKVLGLAAAIEQIDRSAGNVSSEKIEREISLLESQANPLDRTGSEDRVRRLAALKRQRRSVADITRRRSEMSGKLESCALALQNMRLDVVRLRTGTNAESWQHITSVADQAMALAREVDNAVYVADEMARINPRTATPRSESGRS
jgi:eukaryotic-like serine/threonine-protein kinase